MIRLPPRSTRTDTLFPYTTLFRSETLRNSKKAAHAAFDPLWKGKIAIEGCRPHKARRLGYEWLAAQLGIHVDQCHIGWFDEEQCQRVIEICEPYSVALRTGTINNDLEVLP